jgi:hypothetical protein
MGVRKLVRKPILGKAWQNNDFTLLNQNSAGYWWFPYPISLSAQKSMRVEIREVDVKLSELVEDTLDYLVQDSDAPSPITEPQRALELYDAFVHWRLTLPPRIRLEEAVLPSAILLQYVPATPCHFDR